MAPATRLKLYGERNTGTRYVTRLLEHNLHFELLRDSVPRWVTWLQAFSAGRDSARDAYFARTYPSNLGWKHSEVRVDLLEELAGALDCIHFVALVKNPYSWLLSLERRPYHRRSATTMSDIEALVTHAWPTVGRENGPAAYGDAIDLWNRKVRSYLELAERWPTTVLTYEQLVIDPAAALESIRAAGGENWKHGRFENLSESTKEKGKDSSFYRDYYGNELWRSKLKEREISLINERLDCELMSRLGYRLLEVADAE